MTVDKWDENTLAYAAGLLDGEGCFNISTVRGKYHKACVSCSNTNKPVICWLKDTFGGSTSQSKGKKSNHRTIYNWQVVASDAELLCKVIVPYLKIKTEQALILIALRQTNSKQDAAQRDWLWARSKECKRETFD